MTSLFLQEALAEELDSLFSDFRIENEKGELVKPSVHKQDLPYNVDYRDDEISPMPYIIVKLLNGVANAYEECQSVDVALILCAYDDEVKRHGYIDVVNMINKIYGRFMKNPILGRYFEFALPFEWAMQDEETYPYFYGVIQMAFNCPNIIREDKFA